MILIQCATPLELKALSSVFEKSETVVCAIGGVGSKKASGSARALILKHKPTLVVDFGAAGGLVQDLKVGDVIIANQTVSYEGNSLEITCSSVSTSFKEIRRGALLCGDRDIVSIEERRSLSHSTGAIAACWEAHAVAKICEELTVSFFSLRVITDVGENTNHKEFIKEYLLGAEKALLPAASVLKNILSNF